jgi:hypothetical protein
MNINVLNIDHYRVTDNSGRSFQLFNRDTDRIENITKTQYLIILQHQSTKICDMIMDSIKTKENG